ncbi:hypothetical protein HDU67_010055 [Dinochytrium kinnereticum]|nr:hypothetical protein HDU67_010055 [Dinochytrium kinnereticum]
MTLAQSKQQRADAIIQTPHTPSPAAIDASEASGARAQKPIASTLSQPKSSKKERKSKASRSIPVLLAHPTPKASNPGTSMPVASTKPSETLSSSPLQPAQLVATAASLGQSAPSPLFTPPSRLMQVVTPIGSSQPPQQCFTAPPRAIQQVAVATLAPPPSVASTESRPLNSAASIDSKSVKMTIGLTRSYSAISSPTPSMLKEEEKKREPNVRHLALQQILDAWDATAAARSQKLANVSGSPLALQPRFPARTEEKSTSPQAEVHKANTETPPPLKPTFTDSNVAIATRPRIFIRDGEIQVESQTEGGPDSVERQTRSQMNQSEAIARRAFSGAPSPPLPKKFASNPSREYLSDDVTQKPSTPPRSEPEERSTSNPFAQLIKPEPISPSLNNSNTRTLSPMNKDFDDDSACKQGLSSFSPSRFRKATKGVSYNLTKAYDFLLSDEEDRPQKGSDRNEHTPRSQQLRLKSSKVGQTASQASLNGRSSHVESPVGRLSSSSPPAAINKDGRCGPRPVQFICHVEGCGKEYKVKYAYEAHISSAHPLSASHEVDEIPPKVSKKLDTPLQARRRNPSRRSEIQDQRRSSTAFNDDLESRDKVTKVSRGQSEAELVKRLVPGFAGAESMEMEKSEGPSPAISSSNTIEEDCGVDVQDFRPVFNNSPPQTKAKTSKDLAHPPIKREMGSFEDPSQLFNSSPQPNDNNHQSNNDMVAKRLTSIEEQLRILLDAQIIAQSPDPPSAPQPDRIDSLLASIQRLESLFTKHATHVNIVLEDLSRRMRALEERAASEGDRSGVPSTVNGVVGRHIGKCIGEEEEPLIVRRKSRLPDGEVPVPVEIERQSPSAEGSGVNEACLRFGSLEALSSPDSLGAVSAIFGPKDSNEILGIATAAAVSRVLSTDASCTGEDQFLGSATVAVGGSSPVRKAENTATCTAWSDGVQATGVRKPPPTTPKVLGSKDGNGDDCGQDVGSMKRVLEDPKEGGRGTKKLKTLTGRLFSFFGR